jgi:type I restriction enzyme S subunit
MAEWERVSLGEVVSICTGKLDANVADVNGAYPFFTCSIEPLRINKYAFDCDAILVAGNGDLNVKHYHGKFNAYQRTYVICATKENKIFSRYLYYFLDRYLITLRKQSIGGVIKYIKIGNLTEAIIPLPPLEEQRRIAAILESADAIRTKRKAAIAKLDELAQSIFLDMFGDPVKNEKGWDVKIFNELCESRLGKMLDEKKQIALSKYKYLRNTNVQWFQIDQNEVAEIGLSDSEKEILALKKGDILMCEGGEPGRCAIWEHQEEMYYQKALHRIRVIDKKIDQQYFVYLFWLLAHRNGLKDYISVSTIAHLPGEKLKAMKIPVPPYELQKSFCNKILELNVLRRKTQMILSREEQLFSSLQQRAFSGEL